MTIQGYSQLILLAAAYSFIGWVIEVIVCSIPEKRFINRGFLYGPYCPIYGVGAVVVLALTTPFASNPALVFLAALLSTTILEYLTGLIMELLFQIRWWDYSNRKFNIAGRVCLLNSVVFGVMGLFVVYVAQPWMENIMAGLGDETVRSLASLILVVFLIDLLFTLNTLLKLSDRLKALHVDVRHLGEESAERMRGLLEQGGQRFRHLRSFPNLKLKEQLSKPFKRPGFYELFWVFMAAGVLGYVIETVYCLAASGRLSSRQGLLYGPFNQIYGLGAVLMVLALGRIERKGERWLFIGSALLGGTIEYICSLVQEKVFHSVSWGYDEQLLSIGGRTNLIYMIFWGILGCVFIKDIYPFLVGLIDRIPKRQGLFFSWALIVLLLVDMFLSATAVWRWGERQIDPTQRNAYHQFLDTHYPDDTMRAVYPSMEWMIEETADANAQTQ